MTPAQSAFPPALPQDFGGRRIIYDFGANNGDDIPYYLMKADFVVAVEANPVLCRKIEDRFTEEISHGRLVVENCVLTVDGAGQDVDFYIHTRNHVLSQFPAPRNVSDFEMVRLPSNSPSRLIAAHGRAYYVKIDVEHYDEAILRDLFQNNIRPAFLSAESHGIDVFSILVSMGRYDAFKLVDGPSVPVKYRNHRILVNGRYERYSFPVHSAGPFGEDIDGQWMAANDFFQLLAIEGLGWKDIHATNVCPATATSRATRALWLKSGMRRRVRSLARMLRG